MCSSPSRVKRLYKDRTDLSSTLEDTKIPSNDSHETLSTSIHSENWLCGLEYPHLQEILKDLIYKLNLCKLALETVALEDISNLIHEHPLLQTSTKYDMMTLCFGERVQKRI
jgi:hypothetical protein